MEEDTIAAIATPLGAAGISVIRISGANALAVADACFRSAGKSRGVLANAPTHTIHYGHIFHDGRCVDEVLTSVMRGPRTYTREDVIEISCHGGMTATRSVLDTILSGGARLAQPGEFTKRAFLNGRIDLSQAEAVADIIHARTEFALAAAQRQLKGSLSTRIELLRDDLIKILAHLEAHIDFPDEDIAPDTQSDLVEKLGGAVVSIRRLLATAAEGQILRHGIRVAILGRPNVGKSSLLNRLLGRDRAIVSPIPGTTRDTVEEIANVRGIPFVFVDTAGLRDSPDEVERQGVLRSRDAAANSEIILHVIDSSASLPAEDQKLFTEFVNRKRILVLNKTDLPEAPQPDLPRSSPVIRLSALSGDGLELLKDALKELVWSGEVTLEAAEIMINSRHQEALKRALAATEESQSSLRRSANLEITAMELRIAVNAVGEVVGKTSTEDILDSIFSQFCIGK